jgi:shikimate kinase
LNVVLIGFRGTGKSTVARLLAQRLGWSWVDADALLEEQAGRTIREIFEAEGEVGFRDRESALIRQLSERDQTVIAAGGGAVLRAENRLALKNAGPTVWLVAPPEVIEQRLAADATTAQRRPPLTSRGGQDEIRQLLAEREPLYRACADLIVDTSDRTPHETAEAILRWLAEKALHEK